MQQALDWANQPIADEVWQAIEALPCSTDDPEATRVHQPDQDVTIKLRLK